MKTDFLSIRVLGVAQARGTDPDLNDTKGTVSQLWTQMLSSHSVTPLQSRPNNRLTWMQDETEPPCSLYSPPCELGVGGWCYHGRI